MTSPARPGEWVMVPRVATERMLSEGIIAWENAPTPHVPYGIARVRSHGQAAYAAATSASPAFTLTEEAISAAKDAQAFYVSSSDQGYFVRSLPQPGTIVSGPYESWWDAIDASAKMNARSAILAFLHHLGISVEPENRSVSAKDSRLLRDALFKSSERVHDGISVETGE